MKQAACLILTVCVCAAAVACSSPARAPIRMTSRGEPEEPEGARRVASASSGASEEVLEQPAAAEAAAPVEDDGDPAAEEAYDFSGESLGELSFELDGEGVEGVLGKPSKRTPVVMEEAVGLFVSTWQWPKQGIEIRMAAERKAGPFRVSSMVARAPSTRRTSKGIGLGSTPEAIEAAYGKTLTHVEESSVVVGSVYGGLLFELEEGRVRSIFIGASAE
jgi:hypothetical protein